MLHYKWYTLLPILLPTWIYMAKLVSRKFASIYGLSLFQLPSCKFGIKLLLVVILTASQRFSYIYRPQTKFAKVMFSKVSVCPRGCLPHCMLGYTPHPPRPEADNPRPDTLGTRHPSSVCWEIWATSRWYASYWNAYLFIKKYMEFSYFEFKIRLIRLGLSFELTTYWFILSHSHYTKETTIRGRNRKVTSDLRWYLPDSSWIHLILLIKLIKYKTEKNAIMYTSAVARFIIQAFIMDSQLIRVDLVWDKELA